MNSRQDTIEVRNALFGIADGKPADAVMQGIIMAQAKMAAGICKGDETMTRAMLEEYHRMQMEAVPIYCTEILTGQSIPS